MDIIETLILLGMGGILGAFAMNWIHVNSKKTTSGKGGSTNDGSTPTDNTKF
jgi:hypothetical protein